MVDPYVEDIAAYLESQDGPCLLATLGERVQKPKGLPKLKVVLESHPSRFALQRNSEGHFLVHLIAAHGHNFHDASLKHMFSVLHAMYVYYQGRSWPSKRDVWLSDYARGLGYSTRAAATLFELRNGGYVTVKGGTDLTWKMERICDTVKRMPDTLKIEREEASSRPSTPPGHTAGFSRSESKSWKMADGTQCVLVDSEACLQSALHANPHLRGQMKDGPVFIAVDCEGVPQALELIQVSLPNNKVILFDCRAIGAEKVCQTLRPLLESSHHVKLMHDLHKDALALAAHGQVSLRGVLDTQLVAEYLWGDPFVGLNNLLEKLELKLHPSKDFVHSRMRSGVDVFGGRPIPASALEYAAMDASMLHAAAGPIKDRLTENEVKLLITVSEQRAVGAVLNDAARSICFDKNNAYTVASAELIRTLRPSEGFFGERLEVVSETKEVLEVLPLRFRAKMETFTMRQGSFFTAQLLSPQCPKSSGEFVDPKMDIDRLNDVVLDIGRRPQCWIGEDRIFFMDDENETVSADDINQVSNMIGAFGTDNRAGLDGKLHRFSAIRSRDNQIAGLTIRIGRHVYGNAAMLMDHLMGCGSILFVGEPGAGKTTIVREATRILAQTRNVFVVDTSNEIAGDGMIPHKCIGLARRMMVPSLDQQSAIMVQCVQNHTPHVMVIDEIGRSREVEAARTVKQRGVRMIASAHGDLRKLLKNKDLRGLLGGIEVVTMGDDMAREEAKRKEIRAISEGQSDAKFSVSKTKVQRASEPTFDVIVEVSRDSRHEWRIVADSAKAVDAILNGLQYRAVLRSRDVDTGALRQDFVTA